MAILDFAREIVVPPSSASASLLLPFGSLMGTIPIDSVERGRVLGDFGSVLAGPGRRPSDIQQQIHSVIDFGPPAPRGRRLAK
jgi:hypothetical protein